MRSVDVRLLLASIVLSLLVAMAIQPVSAGASSGPVLTGRLVDQAGSPVAYAQISVHYRRQPTDKLSRNGECLTQPGRRTVCGAFSGYARTAPDGTWRMPLPVGQPVSSPGLHGMWPQISAPAGAQGYATTFITFSWDGRSKSTGTQVLWTPDLTVTRSGSRATMQLALPPGAQGTTVIELLKDGQPVWVAPTTTDGTVSVDQHVLEGTTGVRARAQRQGVQWNTWTSPAPSVGTPLSRGLACSTYRTNDALAALRSCGYTDGNLLKHQSEANLRRDLPSDACNVECPTPRTLVFAFKALTVMDAVVWRSCERCTLEVSLDGSTWTPWLGQRQDGASSAVLTGSPMPIKSARIRGSAATFTSLVEVSFWGKPVA